MHSRKKRITLPTAEEILAENQRLEKIQRLHQLVFDQILSKTYTAEGFVLSEKAMMVSPDIYTFLNFRKNLLISKISEASPEEKVKIFVAELDLLSKIIKESPKSYTLWYHRQ